MKDVTIEGLGRGRVTLIEQDNGVVFLMASMPNDKAENGAVHAVVGLGRAALAQLAEFVKEVNE